MTSSRHGRIQPGLISRSISGHEKRAATFLTLGGFDDKIPSAVVSLAKRAGVSILGPPPVSPDIPGLEEYLLRACLSFPVPVVLVNVKIGTAPFGLGLETARKLCSSLGACLVSRDIVSSFLLTEGRPVGLGFGPLFGRPEIEDVLRGKAPLDLLKIVVELTSELLSLVSNKTDRTVGKNILREIMLEERRKKSPRQHRDADSPGPPFIVVSQNAGYLEISSKLLSDILDQLDRQPCLWGILLDHSRGDYVSPGDRLAKGLIIPSSPCGRILKELPKVFSFSNRPLSFRPLIIERIGPVIASYQK